MCAALLCPLSAGATELVLLDLAPPARALCGELPAGWEQPEYQDNQWPTPSTPVPVDAGAASTIAPAPAAATDGASPGDGGVPACAVLHGRTRFDAGDGAARLLTLTLRARYRDGFVAWINGVEVARRRLPPKSEWAEESHGWESESIALPLTKTLLRPSGNVLSVEVRPFRATRRPKIELALEGADAPRILRGPYLQRVDEQKAQLIADSDLPTVADLELSAAGRPAKHFHDEAALHHLFQLSGLRPDTTYHYRFDTRASPSSTSTIQSIEDEFHTAPNADRPLRFVVLGDVRSGHEIHAAILKAVESEHPQLVVSTGDLVDRGSEDGEWEKFFSIETPLLRKIALYVAPGNHDYATRHQGYARFMSFFSHPADTPWYAFDISGVHFVMLDSTAYENPEQKAWLERDLTDSAGRHGRRPRAIFVLAHAGPYSAGIHGDNHTAIHDYVPLYLKHHVTLVISGHDHHYERGKVGALDYVISGGGGAELRDFKCGVPGRPACALRARAMFNEHHYLTFEVTRDHVEVCPKRADQSLLEPCTKFRLRQ